MVSKLRKIEDRTARFLMAEGLLLTFPAIFLTSEAIPLIMLGVYQIAIPLDGQDIPRWRRIIDVLPYLGGVSGLACAWYSMTVLCRTRSFPINLYFAFSIGGAILATDELVRILGVPATLLFAAPAWVLVAHLLYLRWRPGALDRLWRWPW